MNIINKYPIIMIVLGVLGISMSSIIVKFSTAPSAVTALYRLSWTVVLMLPFMIGKKDVREELFSVDKKTLLLSLFSGIFLAIHFILWFESLSFTSVASSTTIVCTEVIWVALGYCLFLKGKIPFKGIISIVIALIGSTVIAFSDSSDKNNLYGDILALLAAIAVAIYMLLGRTVRKTASNSVYTFLVYLSCTISLAVVCLFKRYPIFQEKSAVIAGLLLSIFSTLLGHSIFSWCLKYFSPSFVSASKQCEPVIAAILAAMIFKELPDIMMLLGGFMILSGVFIYSLVENKNQ